jgi:hypothetical protein
MAFFDNFSKKVQDVAFVATEKAQQVAAVAGEKANAVADKAKTEYEMASERRSMDKNYRAIGEWYVSTLEGDAPEAVADIVAAIKASQKKLAAYEAAKAEAAAAKKAQAPIIEVTIEKDAEEEAPAAEEPKEPSKAEETKED